MGRRHRARSWRSALPGGGKRMLSAVISLAKDRSVRKPWVPRLV